MNPSDFAKKGDVDFFKEAELDVILNSRTQSDDASVLGIAAQHGHLSCCEEIIRRCPSLLYHKNKFGNTALHVASLNSKPEITNFLIRVAQEKEVGVLEGETLLTMVNNNHWNALQLAVDQGYNECATLLTLADHDRKLSRMVTPHKDTVLHWAVKDHNLEIVKLLVEIDPEFEYPINNYGQTPLLISLQQALSGNPTAVSIRKLLIEKQHNQCNVRMGTNNWTVLHHAAYNGDLSATEDIIRFCPDCLELTDKDGHNFLHIAVKFDRVNLVKHILGLTIMTDGILNRQDTYGNTPLHIAAFGGNESMVESLLYDIRVEKTIVNKHGQSALNAINFDYDKRKAGVYGLTERKNEREVKEQTDLDLLVGALIGTVSFAAVLTVPGGFINDGSFEGTAILATKTSFKVFAISNSLALLLSLYAVFSHFCVKHLRKKEDVIHQLDVATYCSLCAIFAMVIAFITGSYATLFMTPKFAIIMCVFCSCFFLFASRAMLRMATQQRTSSSASSHPHSFQASPIS